MNISEFLKKIWIVYGISGAQKFLPADVISYLVRKPDRSD